MSIDAYAEIRALRTVIRDLVALSAVPMAWVGREPAVVAAGLADVLTGLLQLDFVFVRLRVPGVDGAADVTRGNAWKTFPGWLENYLAESGRYSGMEVIPDIGGGVEPCRGVVIPIGVNAEGLVAVACDRAGFPTEIDQLLLSLAANHAATAFQSAALVYERMRAEEELRKARDELEMKVAERTAELRRSEAYLSEAQRLTHTGTAALNGATGEITHSSDEHSRLYGFDPRQGMPSFEEFRQRVHPDDRAGWTDALKSGMSKAARIEGEFRVVPPGGPLKHLRAIVHPAITARGELKEFVGTVVDVTERRLAEEEHRAQLWFLESLDAIDRAIQGTNDLERMMGDVLDAVLVMLRCDRAWLLYPCDPEAGCLRVPMERTRPEYPGAGVGVDIPNEPEVAEVSRSLLAADGPVRFDPGSDCALPPRLAERFGIKSIIAMAVHPKVDKPYAFGLHQCSHPRVWTPQEERLFHEIGRRLGDALNTLLMFHNLRESQRKLEGSRAELAASRARIVTAADQTRRRIERDLHDGVQQRLVSLALAQRQAAAIVPPEHREMQTELSRVADGLAGALEELQEISRGIHPAILAHGGLAAALKTLARRSTVPVELEIRIEARLPEPVEVAAYYIVSEALTNTAKHALASAVHVAAEARDGVLRLSIRDDGRGGADPARGSGLTGLTDRVDAVGGTIEVASPIGAGTTLLIRLPIEGR
jgi:signal transduction histidine kinase/PAS domain-containing protein